MYLSQRKFTSPELLNSLNGISSRRAFSLLWLCLLTFLLSSCGYRWQPDYPTETRPKIAVPFIGGDEDGSLTQAICRALITSGLADVRMQDADYRLQAQILSSANETIGYRRDSQKIKGKIKKNLQACEARKSLTLEVTLYEGNSDRIAYGPFQITSDADYDYVNGDSLQDLAFTGPTGVFTIVLPFSLGQLESSEAAQEAATRPLYGRIAQKIVDVISSQW